MMRSAAEIAFQMADSNAGEGQPSQCVRFRAARMLAAIRRTRFLPSSIRRVYSIRYSFATSNGLTETAMTDVQTRDLWPYSKRASGPINSLIPAHYALDDLLERVGIYIPIDLRDRCTPVNVLRIGGQASRKGTRYVSTA